MDTAIRDLDRIEEQDPEEGPGGRIAVLCFAAIVALGAVFAMGRFVDPPPASVPTTETDPLAALSLTEGLTPAIEEPAVIPNVNRQELIFPDRLGEETRPEVLSALAAAGAEYDHLDPIAATDSATFGNGRTQPFGHLSDSHQQGDPMPTDLAAAHALTQAVARVLPAASAAQDTAALLARSLHEDPLVAESVPVTPTRRSVAPGQDGPFTLQVISYRTPEEAEAFASTLRSKGHHAYVEEGQVEGRGTYYRVRIGPFRRQAEATRYRRDFEQQEEMNTFVVRRRT